MTNMSRPKWFCCRKSFKYQLIILTVLYLWTFLYYLPGIYKDKVYSPYFNLEPTHHDVVMRAWNKNSDRLRTAVRYLNWKIAEEETSQESDGRYNVPVIPKKLIAGDSSQEAQMDITIGVVTTQRSVEKERGFRLGYLTQVLAILHRSIKNDNLFRHKHIFICNVDPHGWSYREVSMWSPLFDIIVKNNKSDAQEIEPWEVFEREKNDYQFCLKKTLEYQTPYVILLEDDAVPKQDFFAVIHNMLHKSKFQKSTQLGFVKLYFPEKWAGFGWELSHFLQLALLGSFGAIVGFLVSVLWTLISSKWVSGTQLCVLVMVWAMYAALIAIGVGRQYIINYLGDRWHQYTLIEAKGCCTQAVLYPNTMVEDLVRYLDYMDCDIDNSVDLAIDSFAREKQLQTFLVEPNVVSHIGMFSSLRSYSKNAAEFI